MKKLSRKNQRGAAAVEYALLAFLIALGIATAVTTMRGDMNNVFTAVSNKLK